MHGVFRGLTRESVYFDLKTSSETITGMIDEALTEEDFDRLDALLNRECVARLLRATITSAGKTRVSYLLLNAWPKE